MSSKLALQDVSFFPLNKSMDLEASAQGAPKSLHECDGRTSAAIPLIETLQPPDRDLGRPGVPRPDAGPTVSPRDRDLTRENSVLVRDSTGISAVGSRPGSLGVPDESKLNVEGMVPPRASAMVLPVRLRNTQDNCGL